MKGAVVWFTGLPSSGKSTLAKRTAARFGARGRLPVVLDGDDVRAALVPRHGYTEEARAAFYETLAHLAVLLSQQGHIVLVAATAHRRAFREIARARAPRFIEVFVDTPKEICAARDTKGLYAAAAQGAVPHLPGADATYEPPKTPDLVIHMDSEPDPLLDALYWMCVA